MSALGKFTTTLLRAAFTADQVFVDGSLVDVFNEDDGIIVGSFTEVEDIDTQYGFCDQPIEVDPETGRSKFDDALGDEHIIVFNMVRRMTVLDVIAHRLKS